MKQYILAACMLVCFAANSYAEERKISVADIFPVNPEDRTLALSQSVGSKITIDGFKFEAMINGFPVGDLCLASTLRIPNGMGVGGEGNIGLKRSINRNETVSEAIDITITADAADGCYAGLLSMRVLDASSIVQISGFASNPEASVEDGHAEYQNGTITWTKTEALGTIYFNNPKATPIRTILRLQPGESGSDENKVTFSWITYDYDPARKIRAIVPEPQPRPEVQPEQAKEPLPPQNDQRKSSSQKDMTEAFISVGILLGGNVVLAIIAIIRRAGH